MEGGFPWNSDRVQQAAQGPEIHFLTDYSNDPWQDLWENDIAPPFQENTDTSVNVEYTGFAGAGEERLTTLMQAGEPPESYTGNYGNLGSLFAQNQLEPVDEAVDRIVERMGEINGRPLEVFGHHYTIPHGKYTNTFNYRIDLLEQLGLERPETWEEVIHNAQVIDESDEVQAKGYSLAGAKAGASEIELEQMLSATGAYTWQWADYEKGIPEVWFPKENVVKVLENMKTLAEYSPNPGGTSWGEYLQYWAGGRVAQQLNLNGWGAGVAYNSGNEEIAANSRLMLPPPFEGAEQYGSQTPGFDGHPVIGVADNADGFKVFIEWMYSKPEQVSLYHTRAEPTRFIPAYSKVLDTDVYREAEPFQEVPNLLDLNLQCANEIATQDMPLEDAIGEVTPATVYAARFYIKSELVNQVIAGDRDPEKAYDEAYERLTTRLEEGLQKQRENYGENPRSG